MIYLQLFLNFLMIGALSFGGGYGMISLVRETVLRHGWLTEAEFLSFVAVSESTPGPLAINMATFIGSSQGGFPGALIATLGVVLPSFFIILLIAAVLVVGGLLTAVVLSLRGGSARQEPEADPHAGQVYINDGFNMVWMTPHEGIPASGLAQEDFRRDTNDDGSDGVRVRYLGAEYATRWGVDVSNHQGTIDWAALKRQGIDFAYLRLGLRGYGEKGSLYPDRSFDSYYSGARAAGIDVGVYFFSQAATVQEAAQEALYALQLLDGRDLDLPVYYDWEPVQQEDSRTLHNNEFLLTSQARTFCALIEQGGYEAGVYMNRQQGYYRYDLSSMGNIALWIADPGDYPDFYYRFDVWQYDHGARLDGVNEIVDLNVEFVPVM